MHVLFPHQVCDLQTDLALSLTAHSGDNYSLLLCCCLILANTERVLHPVDQLRATSEQTVDFSWNQPVHIHRLLRSFSLWKPFGVSLNNGQNAGLYIGNEVQYAATYENDLQLHVEHPAQTAGVWPVCWCNHDCSSRQT